MEDRKPANLSSRIVATAPGTDADDELGRVGERDNAILPAFKIWTSPVRLRPPLGIRRRCQIDFC